MLQSKMRRSLVATLAGLAILVFAVPAALGRNTATPNAAAGKVTFTANCGTCHTLKASGSVGNIGPNLTDKTWLHGGKPAQIFKTVNEGVLTKGMAAWGPQLGTDKVQNVVAYVLTLKDTNVAGGKAPQGVEEP